MHLNLLNNLSYLLDTHCVTCCGHFGCYAAPDSLWNLIMAHAHLSAAPYLTVVELYRCDQVTSDSACDWSCFGEGSCEGLDVEVLTKHANMRGSLSRDRADLWSLSLCGL